MVKHNQLNTLLMEILIVVLFFALCSTVILDVFVGAHNQSARAGVQADALTEAQSLIDRLYAADARPRVGDRPWWLANMITSHDGATHVDGLSGGLAAPADRLTFRAIRAVCSGTSGHGLGCIDMST